MRPEEIAERLDDRVPDVVVARGEVTAFVDRDRLLETLEWLRDDPVLRMGFLSSVTATDRPGADPRFWVSYELGSMPLHHRLRVKTGLPGQDPRVPSVTSLYPTANWHERETYDF